MSVWNKVLGVIEQKISKPSYDTWFRNTNVLPYDEDTDTLVIETENLFSRDWLENHYASLIAEVFHDITGKHYPIQFAVNTNQEVTPREYPTYQNHTKSNIEQKLDFILKELKTLNERVNTIESNQLFEVFRAINDNQ